MIYDSMIPCFFDVWFVMVIYGSWSTVNDQWYTEQFNDDDNDNNNDNGNEFWSLR